MSRPSLFAELYDACMTYAPDASFLEESEVDYDEFHYIAELHPSTDDEYKEAIQQTSSYLSQWFPDHEDKEERDRLHQLILQSDSL